MQGKSINIQVSGVLKTLEAKLGNTFGISDRTLILQNAIELVSASSIDWVETATSFMKFKATTIAGMPETSKFVNYQADLDNEYLEALSQIEKSIYTQLTEANKLKRLSKAYALSLILFQSTLLKVNQSESSVVAPTADANNTIDFSASQLMATLTDLLLSDPLMVSDEMKAIKKILSTWKSKL